MLGKKGEIGGSAKINVVEMGKTRGHEKESRIESASFGKACCIFWRFGVERWCFTLDGDCIIGLYSARSSRAAKCDLLISNENRHISWPCNY
jgi:hypothetical protein